MTPRDEDESHRSHMGRIPARRRQGRRTGARDALTPGAARVRRRRTGVLWELPVEAVHGVAAGDALQGGVIDPDGVAGVSSSRAVVTLDSTIWPAAARLQ